MKIIIPLFLAAAVCSVANAQQLKIGDPAPALATGEFVQGEPIKELEKGKAYLIEFWATWCGPCVKAIPHVNELHVKYADKGLVVIGIGVDDDAAKHQAFATKMKASFTLVHDSSHKAAGFFSPPSMPTSYLVDRKGVIRHVHNGFKGAKTEAEYVAEIEALLAE
jgi:peroxiredoxin